MPREVLEGESWSVKQLEHKEIGIKLRQRGDRLVPEIRVGGLDHASHGARLDLACHERRQDGLRDLLVGSARKAGNRVLGELWIGMRKVKAAVRRKAREQHLRERNRRRRAAR